MENNTNYERIVNSFIIAEGSNISTERLKEIHLMAKRMCQISKRHHYIPQYFINGFAGEDKQLYVYDKLLDKIKRKKYFSKSLFYIENLNTVEIDKGFQASFIEDDYFKKVDDSLCGVVKTLRTDPISSNFLTPEIHGQVNIFIADIYWRNPISDITFDSLFEDNENFFKIKMDILSDTNSADKNLKSSSSFKKIFRSGMGSQTIKKILEERKEGNWQSRLIALMKNNLL